jgi:endoglucanase
MFVCLSAVRLFSAGDTLVMDSRMLSISKALAVLVMAVTWASTEAGAQTPHSTLFVHREGARLIAADGKPLSLKGINLGNWLEPEGYMFHFDGWPQSKTEIESLIAELLGPEGSEQFWQEYRENYITRADIEFLRAAGFNSVRVPFNYRFFATEEGFHLLDRLIAWCRAAHLWVILDLHAAPGGQTGTNIDDSSGYPWLFRSQKAQRETIDLWRHIAEHYSNNPTVLGYDLLNEPIPHYPPLASLKPSLEPLLKKIALAVRAVDRSHVLIFEAAIWDSDFSVFGPPFDPNVLYSIHKYWMKPDRSSIQEYLDFRAKYNVPLWVGESGENTDQWISEFRSLLEKNDIGWCFWPYKKMEATSAPVSIARPPYWGEIIAFAKQPTGTGNAEKRIAARPPQDHIDQAFKGLIENMPFAKNKVNVGYLKALGLKVP